VSDGATVIGPRPTTAPSLQDYPACDQQVDEIGKEVWGKADGQEVRENSFGRGRVIWNRPVEDVLEKMGVKPDVEMAEASDSEPLLWIHRRAGATEL
jgi:hypothetical protein